jgi:flagellar basal-body rod protein FlgC
MLNTISIALSGLNAATNRVSASASNIANVMTAGSLQAGKQAPYDALTTRQIAQSDAQGQGSGVQSEVVSAGRPFVPSYAPDSPFADENGIIGTPNVDLAEEAVNLSLAKMTYKANISVIKTAEEMSDELLRIFDDEA